MDLFGDLNTIWLLVRLFLVMTIFGFVRNWTGNNTIALIISGILVYLFVFQYPVIGMGYLMLSHLFLIVVALWFIFLIK